MTRLIILAALTLSISIGPSLAGEKCPFGICDGQKVKTYNSRNVLSGSLYNPGHGRRIQIRDSRRRVIGYIERTGKITDRRRRKVGTIGEAK